VIKFDPVEIAASAYYTTMKLRKGQARQAKIKAAIVVTHLKVKSLAA